MRDAECEALWASVYPSIEAEITGVAGEILARGAAQVLRLSLIYSLFDEVEAQRNDPAIRVPHLLAALAIQDYCKASVLQIFGDATGNYLADRFLRELKEGPQTDSMLYELVGGHAGDRSRKDIALALLVRWHRAHPIRILGMGRPTREWHLGPVTTCCECAKRVKKPHLAALIPLFTLFAHGEESMSELIELAKRHLASKRTARPDWLTSYRELAALTYGLLPDNPLYGSVNQALDCCDKCFLRGDWQRFNESADRVREAMRK